MLPPSGRGGRRNFRDNCNGDDYMRGAWGKAYYRVHSINKDCTSGFAPPAEIKYNNDDPVCTDNPQLCKLAAFEFCEE